MNDTLAAVYAKAMLDYFERASTFFDLFKDDYPATWDDPDPQLTLFDMEPYYIDNDDDDD